ncbi:MAG: DUF3631 domain-containing protein [Gemmatimonadota bacterium]|nr:DUF3631 domain-containing protein [Gemmatimonadota bacterium]
MLDDLVAFIDQYVVLPPHANVAVALWVLHTYLLDVTDYTPYLLVTSPVKACGKTTLLELLLHLAHRAQMTGGITAAALYRRIDRLSPTMLLDEVDTQLRRDGGENLRGVLNTGFQRSGKHTICVGDEHKDTDFSTFCPKVLAGIGKVWDTVTSRSIPLRLARATKQEQFRLTKIRGDRINEACLPLKQRMARWATDNRPSLKVADAVAPDALGARQSDVWRPLLAIADAAGGAWPELSRTAACALYGIAEEEGDSGLLLLQDLKSLFDLQGGGTLSTSSILEALAAMEDRPWPEYSNHRPISKRGLASLVGRFGVKPKNIRLGSEVVKGYEYSALQPAFTTYLTPSAIVATSATDNISPGVADVADEQEGVGTTSLQLDRSEKTLSTDIVSGAGKTLSPKAEANRITLTPAEEAAYLRGVA